ncbi:MAG TPA: DegV family protein [Leptolinea sp.]
MQIVTDQGADLSPEQVEGFNIKSVPLNITINGKTYISGVDIDAKTFYEILTTTQAFPTTSQPSPGDFARVYRELAKDDPEILSIHMSAGISGTVNTARMGADLVPEARVTIIDSKTLSCPLGWQVEAAAKGLRAGMNLEEVTRLLERIQKYAEGMYVVPDLKYLIHGGRISHLKGLMASILKIKPVIGITKDDGKYYTLGQDILFSKAIQRMVDTIAHKMPQTKTLRIQILHGSNPDGVADLRDRLDRAYECWYNKTVAVAPFLGAHVGPGMVGLAVAPLDIFDLPGLDIIPKLVRTLE